MRPRIEKLVNSVKAMTQMTFARQDGNVQWLFLSPGQRKYWRKVGNGSNTSVVAAPLLWIGRNFPEAPPALWQKMPDSGEEELVTGKGEQGGDHLMLELLERPNQYYAGAVFWMATVMDWHLSGNGYWIKVRDRGGRPIELWWTPSGMIEPKGDEKTFIDHYEYRVGGETIELDPENIVHFRYGIDPENPRKGKSPLSALLQEVFTDAEAADFTAALLSNMGVPGLVISPANKDSSPSLADVEATKEYLHESHTGERRGEPLVMSGPTSVTQFGFNPQQLQLREARRIPEERVSAVLGVPAIVAGLGAGLDRSTFANYAEAREAAYQDNIIPAQRLLAEDVRFQLLPDFQPDDYRSFRFGFDLSGVRVLQEDRTDLVSRMDVGVKGGWVRVSEARRVLDLEVDDSDEIYLRPVAVVEIPAGEAVPQPVPQLSPGSPAGPALPPGTEETPDQVEPGQEPPTSQRKQKRTVHRPNRLQSRLAHALNRDRYVLSQAFAGELETSFISLGISCAETYMHMTNPAQAHLAHRSNGSTKIISPETLAQMIVTTLSASFSDVLRKQYEKHVLRVLEQTIKTIEDVAQFGMGVTDQMQASILESAGKRIGLIDIEQVTKDTIFHAIDEGNTLGHNPRDIARTIREEVPAGRFINAGPAYRAQLISRTETNWAMNTSAISAYRESDQVSMCLAMDGSDDPECAARDGQEYTFDEAEVELSEEHPNGTLTFAPIVSDSIGVPA